MNKYRVEVTFVVEVQAKTKEDAEKIGWDWWTKHPLYKNSIVFFEVVHPDSVEVEEL